MALAVSLRCVILPVESPLFYCAVFDLLSFMLTPLFKKPKFASTGGLHADGGLWLLCLLSPSAFSIGIAQVVYLEAQGDGAIFSTLTNGPHALYVPLLMLFLDCILYLLLAVYLDQVLPGNATVAGMRVCAL
ncbi:cholesterol transporter ABCA5-like [Clupea harengus]|uniref:Cholesterol transporter ABCA5-like n=1 Tax=Clupea harengus TaxID=7950 RepID=A0A8M1KBH0_CLUHA|nr:cholesterol transporter ABCA5-like [Clupea harengus]